MFLPFMLVLSYRLLSSPLLTRSHSLFQRMASLKIVTPVPSDIEIAQSVDPVAITDVAEKVCCDGWLYFFFFFSFILFFIFLLPFFFFDFLFLIFAILIFG